MRAPSSIDRHAAAERTQAVLRGMHFIADAASQPECLVYLGTGLLYSLSSLARTAADADLRRYAKDLGRYAFAHWEHETRENADPTDPAWLAEAVRGFAAGEGLGVHRPQIKAYLREAVALHEPAVFLGFDARTGPPPDGLLEPCACGTANGARRRTCRSPACGAPLTRVGRHQTWCVALTSAWCGERLGVPLGARYEDVLRWLPQMRPYRADARSSAQRFHETAYAITHVVYTLNDYGRFLLSPEWLPDEHRFLETHLTDAVALSDPDLTGEFLDALRAFGVPADHAAVRTGFDYLLSAQNDDGSWGEWDEASFYSGFHATWAAIDGLRDYRWSGPALLFPRLLPRLQAWARHSQAHGEAA